MEEFVAKAPVQAPAQAPIQAPATISVAVGTQQSSPSDGHNVNQQRSGQPISLPSDTLPQTSSE